MSMDWHLKELSSNVSYIYLILKYAIFFLSKEHLNQSHPNPKCEHCNKQFTSVNKLNEHKVLECQSLTIDCILEDYGCNEQVYLFFN